MRDILLWGMGDDYDNLLNQLNYEVDKRNIRIVGIICRREDRYCTKRDGHVVYAKEDIAEIPYDYIVITSTRFYKEIEDEALRMGISRNKIIDGRIFHLPLFDFGKYISLVENPITILSDDCWGGYVYNCLKLPFTSPLINIYWPKDEFAKFILEPAFYLQSELKMVSEGDLRKGLTPVASLGYGQKSVTLRMIHNATFEDAKIQWERRCKRINYSNFFVKFGLASNADESLKAVCRAAYGKCNYKKIFTYYGDDIEDAFMSERFIWHELKGERVINTQYADYFRDFSFAEVDILNLLVFGENYARCE